MTIRITGEQRFTLFPPDGIHYGGLKTFEIGTDVSADHKGLISLLTHP